MKRHRRLGDLATDRRQPALADRGVYTTAVKNELAMHDLGISRIAAERRQAPRTEKPS
jgi:hypothetical protein